MPRGENEAFQKRVGKLSKPLIKLNLKRMICRKYPEIDIQRFDFDAVIDPTVGFEANLQSFFQEYGIELAKENPIEDLQVLENELEKYQQKWKEYKKRNNITEKDLE